MMMARSMSMPVLAAMAAVQLSGCACPDCGPGAPSASPAPSGDGTDPNPNAAALADALRTEVPCADTAAAPCDAPDEPTEPMAERAAPDGSSLAAAAGIADIDRVIGAVSSALADAPGDEPSSERAQRLSLELATALYLPENEVATECRQNACRITAHLPATPYGSQESLCGTITRLASLGIIPKPSEQACTVSLDVKDRSAPPQSVAHLTF